MLLPNELKTLSQTLERLTLAQLTTQRAVAEGERDLAELQKVVVARAYSDETITGTNTDIRKVQEAQVVAESAEVCAARERVATLNRELDALQAQVAGVEAEIGLTRAWLYSQARIG